MTPRTFSWLRGLAATAMGVALAVGHPPFAAAMPTDVRQARNAYVEKVTDVDETSSISSEQPHAENCYSEQQFVKSVRGKAMIMRYMECD